MLAPLRQFSQILGRTLLGMLMFVWLTMALAPCVMANSLSSSQLSGLSTSQSGNSDAMMSELHQRMQDCDYCPDDNSTLTMVTLCQTSHDTVADSMNLTVDSIDVESFVLFEIPTIALNTTLYHSDTALAIRSFPQYLTLSPLALTGILRI